MNWVKRTSLFLILLLLIIICPIPVTKAAGKYVYITVEKFTIGQGCIVEPTRVEIEEGDTVAHVFDRVMKSHNIDYQKDGNIEQNFYLSAICKTDTGNVQIPKSVKELEKIWKTPIGENASYPDLAQGSYTSYAGWYYWYNNKVAELAMSNQKVKDGDVIRVQFTLFGWGDDLELSENKDELIRSMAGHTKHSAYAKAKKVLENIEASKTEIRTVVSELEKTNTQSDSNVTKQQAQTTKGKEEVTSTKKQQEPTTRKRPLATEERRNEQAGQSEATTTYVVSGNEIATTDVNKVVSNAEKTIKSKPEATAKSEIETTRKTEAGGQSEMVVKYDMDISTNLKRTGDYILKTDIHPGLESAWHVLGLAASSLTISPEYYQTFYENMLQKVQESKGELSSQKYTEYSKAVLALSAIGADAEQIGGYSLVEALTKQEKVTAQGMNGVIFALLALDGKESYRQTYADDIQKYLDFLLANEIEGGGFALAGDKADPDITAMAVVVLAKHQENINVLPVLERAKSVLYEIKRTKDKSLNNLESNVWLALAGMATDTDLVSKQQMETILAYQNADGSFCHAYEEQGLEQANAMSTEQAFLAMVAYQRYQQGMGDIFSYDNGTSLTKEENLGQVLEKNSNAKRKSGIIWWLTGMVAVILLIVVCRQYKKKKGKTISGKKLLGLFCIFGLVSVLFACGKKETRIEDKSCTISIVCSSILENRDQLKKEKEEFVPDSGILLVETEVKFADGDTVFDILKKACRENSIVLEFSKTVAYQSTYVEGIGQLYEMDCGPASGWQYSVNDQVPQYGCDRIEVQEGDRIVWTYVCDLY